MYAVSQSYMNAIHLPERFVDLKGTITLRNGAVIPVNGNSFQESTLYINKKAVDGDDLNAGSVYASELGVSIFYDKYDYKSFINARIELKFGIEITLGAEDFEYVPLGIFYVDTVEKGAGVVKLVAYDAMIKFDKDYPQNQKVTSTSSKTIYEHLESACSKCGVALGSTQAEIESMPWGKSKVVINPNNSIGRYTPCKSYRDTIGIIAGRLGAFATIGRDNKLYIKPLKGGSSNYKLKNEQIFSITVTDCSPDINFVSFTRKNNSSVTVGDEKSRGLTINSGNQFFDNSNDDECKKFLNGILANAKTISYFPTEITWSGDPAIDLGDYIMLPEYEGGCMTLVTGMNWRYRGKSKITSVGKENTSKVRSNLNSNLSATIEALDKLTQTVEEITEPIVPTDPTENKGDHYTVLHKSEQLIDVTSSIVIRDKYQSLPETNGSTVEYIPGVKSVDNPSSITCKIVNGESLYSLPDGTCDTIAINDETITVNHNCGHIIIDNTAPDVYAWRHSGASNVPDGYFCVSWLSNTINDKILASTTNMYCNRLEPVANVASSVSASVVISNKSGVYIVLPTGTCEETDASLHEWLGTHPIEIVYPLAIPFAEEYSTNCDETLMNMSTINKNVVEHYIWDSDLQKEQYQIAVSFNAFGGSEKYTYQIATRPDLINVSWHIDENIYSGSENAIIGFEWGNIKNFLRIRATDSAGNYKDRIFTITTT